MSRATSGECRQHTLTVLGTADLHGYVLDWDYHRDAPYEDAWGNAVGLARVATVVRRERTVGNARLLVDAGDFLQGTHLASYAAERLRDGQPHPVAAAMNALGYDAVVVGNHEFDFGLDALRSFEGQASFPLLAANVAGAFAPYVIRDIAVPGGPPVRVAIVGLAHPLTAVWNRSQVDGALRFEELVGAAERWVPHVRAAGADVVIVAAHAGTDDGVEGIAEQVSGIDAILAGHAHREVECQEVTHVAAGERSVLTMPMCWGMRVSAIDLTVESFGDRYRVVGRAARLIDSSGFDQDPEILGLVESDHHAVIAAGRTVVGRSAESFNGCDARWQPSPLVSLVQHVQAVSVVDRVGPLPLLSVASIPHHAAEISAGSVTRRDIETIATFDNRVVAVRMTGAEVRAHLETAALYFTEYAPGHPAAAQDIVNAQTTLHPNGTPDFAYDSIAGFAAPLEYEIDLAHKPGARIRSLTYAGEPVADAMPFAVAMSAFRRTGAHGYQAAADATLLCESDVGVRRLLTDWVGVNSPITSAMVHHDGWRLTYDGATLDIVDEVYP